MLDERRKGGIDLLRVARTYDMKLKPELTRCVLRLLRVQPIFTADSVTLVVSRENDGKSRLVYAGWDDVSVVQPDG